MNVSSIYHSQTEREFQGQVVKLAELFGWRVYHTYRSDRSAAGFPDLVLVHPEKRRCLFVEVKSERGKATRAQVEWMTALDAAGQEIYVWKPSQWRIVERVLR